MGKFVRAYESGRFGADGRLFWFTVEFGVIREQGRLRFMGAD